MPKRLHPNDLTLEQEAVAKSIEMWEWIVKTGRRKDDWPGWSKTLGRPACDCFLCEYDNQHNPKEDCSLCPLESHKLGSCMTLGYKEYSNFGSNALRKEAAKRFLSNLKLLQSRMK
jgi:hypothetical protein